jgi:excisionase family DNA binding protein
VEHDTTPTIKPLLTIRQAAGALHISEVTLRRMVKNGTGPTARRIGRSLRFREQDVRDFVEAH